MNERYVEVLKIAEGTLYAVGVRGGPVGCWARRMHYNEGCNGIKGGVGDAPEGGMGAVAVGGTSDTAKV